MIKLLVIEVILNLSATYRSNAFLTNEGVYLLSTISDQPQLS